MGVVYSLFASTSQVLACDGAFVVFFCECWCVSVRACVCLCVCVYC